MLFLAFIFSTTAFLLLFLIPSAFAGYNPGQPQLHHEARRMIDKRSFSGSLGFLFSERDSCGTQFGPTWVDCGREYCFQPSLGEVCCTEGFYCFVGQYCSGNNCCPNGLDFHCCNTGEGCPANVSDYYTSTYSTPPPAGTTSFPVALTTSVEASTTSSKPSTSTAVVVTSSAASAPATLKSTSSVVVGITTSITNTSSGTSSTNTSGVATTFVPASGAQVVELKMVIKGVAVAVLGVIGFITGLT